MYLLFEYYCEQKFIKLFCPLLFIFQKRSNQVADQLGYKFFRIKNVIILTIGQTGAGHFLLNVVSYTKRTLKCRLYQMGQR